MPDPNLLPQLPHLLRLWRRETARETALPPELLDELEDHLVSLLEEEVRKRTPSPQAWTHALSRLGKAAGLDGGSPGTGRSPSSPSRMRRLRPWALAAVLFLALWLSLLLTKRSAVLSPLLTFHIASVTLGYGAVFLGAFLSAVYLIQRLFRSPTFGTYQNCFRLLSSGAGAAALLTGIGVISGSLWANAHLGRYFVWDARDTGGILVTLWNVAIWWASSSRRITGHTPMITACVGGVLVAWSWFGANAWVALERSSGSTEHGFSIVWTSLFVFTSIETALAFSALLPAACLGQIRRRGREVDLLS